MIGFPPYVTVPDAGFRQPLAHIGSAIGGEDKWHAERLIQAVFPGAMWMRLFPSEHDGAGIALGLSQGGRHINALALRLDDTDASDANEQRVIRSATFRRPFGDCNIAAFFRSGTVL